jgi:HNH endonuclease
MKTFTTKADETPEVPIWLQIKKTAVAAGATVCCVEGCDRPRRLRQYCGMHYARLKRAGIHPKDEPRIKTGKSHEFFLSLLSKETKECIAWPYSKTLGYGTISFKHKTHRVNRLVCEAVRGPAPDSNHEAAHECGNSDCCNPAHLLWKIHKDNIADKIQHGTLPLGEKHHAAKLTRQNVIDIRASRNEVPRSRLASIYGVGLATIDNVLSGATWKEVI